MFNTFKDNFSSIDSQKYEEFDQKLNEFVTELNDKRGIDFDFDCNVKQEVDSYNGYEKDNELNVCEDSIGSEDKQTLEKQLKRQEITRRLISESPDCQFNTNSVQELQEHWNNNSDCRYMTDTLCDINRYIAVHLNPNHNSDTISAVIEDIIARNDSHSDEDRAEREVNVTDKFGTQDCKYCGETFRRYSGLVTHINSCHPDYAIEIDRRRPLYTCDLDNCKLGFLTLSLMFDHQKCEHTIDKPFVCTHPDCHYESLDPKDFHSHRMTHSLNRPFVCTVVGCDKRFYDKKSLASHKFSGHREKTYNCSHGCDKMFKTHNQMKNHVQSVHMRVKNHRCEWPGCEYSAYYKKNVDRHYKAVHTKQKNFVCDLCDKRFVHLSDLPKHKRISHKMGPLLTCSWPECDYSTHNSIAMSRHTFQHQNGPRFACPECGKRIKDKQNLELHINGVHKKLKPLSCPVLGCPFRTAYRRCISQHMILHNK